MSLRKLRRLLTIILIVIMAAGSSMLFTIQIVNLTLCSESFSTRFFQAASVTSQCKENYSKRMEAFEAKSGIPSKVFEAVFNLEDVTSDTAIHRFYSGNDTTLDNQSNVEKIEGLCKEYFDASGIKYDEKQLEKAAQEAVDIYSDCFGIKDSGYLRSSLDAFNNSFDKLVSISCILTILPFVLIIFMFSKSYDIALRAISAFTASGFSMMISGVLCVLFNVGKNFVITPDFYAAALSKEIDFMFYIMIIFGAILGFGSLIVNIVITDQIKNTASER